MITGRHPRTDFSESSQQIGCVFDGKRHHRCQIRRRDNVESVLKEHEQTKAEVEVRTEDEDSFLISSLLVNPGATVHAVRISLLVCHAIHSFHSGGKSFPRALNPGCSIQKGQSAELDSYPPRERFPEFVFSRYVPTRTAGAARGGGPNWQRNEAEGEFLYRGSSKLWESPRWNSHACKGISSSSIFR